MTASPKRHRLLEDSEMGAVGYYFGDFTGFHEDRETPISFKDIIFGAELPDLTIFLLSAMIGATFRKNIADSNVQHNAFDASIFYLKAAIADAERLLKEEHLCDAQKKNRHLKLQLLPELYSER